MSYLVLNLSEKNTISDYSIFTKDIVNGALIKVGYRDGFSGELVKDSLLDTHYNSLKSKGIRLGYYWNTNAITTNEAIDEADYLYSNILGKDNDFPVYIESKYYDDNHTGRADNLSVEDRTEIIAAFCDRLTELGFSAGIYAEDSWISTQLDYYTIASKGYSIWNATYSTEMPSLIADYDGWQFSSEGSFSDYTGIGFSIFYNNIANWSASSASYTITNSSISLTNEDETFTYNGNQLKPDITVNLQSDLVADQDYKLLYADNINAGYGIFVVKGLNNYKDIILSNFEINPRVISNSTISFGEADDNNCYNINDIKIVSDLDTALEEDTDYTLESSNTMVTDDTGFAYYETIITITGKNNWTGTLTSNQFNSSIKDVSLIDFSLDSSSYQYTGSEIKPTISTVQGIYEGADYTVSYSNNIELGTGIVTITGIDEYSGTKTIEFQITAASISDFDISLVKSSYTYTGSEIKPEIKTTLSSDDYEISYSNNIYVGTGSVTVQGIKNYTDQKVLTFTIAQRDISSDATITCGDPDDNDYYDLANLIVKIDDIELARDTDYQISISYSASEISGASTATITITGIDNYTGTVSENYLVSSSIIDINSLTPTINTNYTYTGEEITIDISYEGLTLGTDYTVTNGSHTNAGSYRVFIQGIGNYTGSKNVTMLITTAEITADNITVDYGTATDGLYNQNNYSIKCNGNTLVENTDYILSGAIEPDSNYEYEVYSGYITGIGNYSGSVDLEDKPISKCSFDIEDYEFEISESSFTFNGQAHQPTVECTSLPLIQDTHYTLSYEDNVNAGTGKVIITGKYGFKNSTKEIEFVILPLDIDSLDIDLKTNSFVYTGSDITLEIKLPEVDYDITYTMSDDYETVNAGSYEITLTGTGNFEGTKVLDYDIIGKSISGSNTVISCGEPNESGYYDLGYLSVTIDSTELYEGEDYEITKKVTDNSAGDSYAETTVTIAGIGNYSGEKSATFKVEKTYIDISIYAVYLDESSFTYTGSEIKPKPTIGINTNITEGSDYELEYSNNTNVGTALIMITGTGTYNGYTSTQFTITSYDFSKDHSVSCGDPDDNGYYNIDNLVVKVPGTNETLEKDVDYTISTSDTVSNLVVTTTVTVTGIGNYSGSFTTSYVTGRTYIDINTVEFSVPKKSYEYTAEEIVFDLVTNLTKGKDYTCNFSDNTELGTATITITGTGDYTGTKTLHFEIVTKDFSEDAVITCGEPDINGYYSLDELVVSVGNNTLKVNVDYTLSVETTTALNFINTSHIIITGIGNYTGTVEASFQTGKGRVDINNIDFSIDNDNYVYTGDYITPFVYTSLIEDFDYTLVYADNKDAGIATITITGIGNYMGSLQLAFRINIKDLSSGTISCGTANALGCYDISNLTVELDGKTLTKGTDYSLKTILDESSSKHIVTNVTVTGINNYSGTITASFRTAKVYKNIAKYTFTLEKDTFNYTGSAHTPEVSCEDLEDSDYNVYYEDNINAGTGKVLIYGSNEYTGTVELTFTINQVDISSRAYVTCGEADEDGCYDITNARVYLDYIDSGYMNGTDYELEMTQIDEDDYITVKIVATGKGNYTGSVSDIFNTKKIEQEEKKPNNTDVELSEKYKAGTEVTLENVTIYPRYGSTKSNITKTGTFYIWNNYILNDRIRITTRLLNAEQPGQIIGWVNVSDLENNSDFEVGDAVVVTGNITKNADGTGNTISKSNSIMYIVDLEDNETYTNYIGLASGVNNTRQGWASESMVEKYSS